MVPARGCWSGRARCRVPLRPREGQQGWGGRGRGRGGRGGEGPPGEGPRPRAQGAPGAPGPPVGTASGPAPSSCGARRRPPLLPELTFPPSPGFGRPTGSRSSPPPPLPPSSASLQASYPAPQGWRAWTPILELGKLRACDVLEVHREAGEQDLPALLPRGSCKPSSDTHLACALAVKETPSPPPLNLGASLMDFGGLIASHLTLE